MNRDKGFAVALDAFESWALGFIGAIIDTLTLVFRVLYGLFFVDDATLDI